MIVMLMNHLWQSTLFALAVAILTLVLRRDGAHTRYWLWQAASIKFLIPFSILVTAGGYFSWHETPIMSLRPTVVAAAFIAQPFPSTTSASLASAPAAPGLNLIPIALTIWACGFIAILAAWFRRWRRIASALRAAAPLQLAAAIPVKSTPSLLEPGIVGIFRPILLLPEGIAAHLTPDELDAIVAHELWHVRRRDNLMAIIHMLVQALFWFHPLVWWLGARLVEERERACDEAVVKSGNAALTYAEAILKVCKFYIQSPLACAAGISGADLKKRIEGIMTNHARVKLHFAKKCLLLIAVFVALAVPLSIGFAKANEVAMKHYKNTEWNFELDIPKNWNAFPPVSTNSPYEVIRLESHEDGHHVLIIFRQPYDPKGSPKAYSDKIQQVLTKAGFSNFVTGETTIGSRTVLTLDFDKTINGDTWSCRHYIIIDGTLAYVLGFGTNKRDAMFDMYDHMAKSFVSKE